jgi:hypothetical protein
MLERLPCFSAVQIAAVLHVARMRGHSHIGHTEEMPGNDRSHLKAIEVLPLHLGQNRLKALCNFAALRDPKNIALTSAAMKKKFHPAA